MTAHPQYLTATRLRRLHACPEQVNLFRATFGEVVEVCPMMADMALTAGLSLAWLANIALTGAAQEEYGRVAAMAWVEYLRARDAARAAYVRVKDEAAARLLADPAKWMPGILTAGAQ